jgi:hypothetical protein
MNENTYTWTGDRVTKYEPRYTYEKTYPAPYGLSFCPLPTNIDANSDFIDVNSCPLLKYKDIFYTNASIEYEKVIETMELFKSTPINIMEIGISAVKENSFTNALINTKHSSSIYVGVDVDDKSNLDNKDKKIFTIKSRSEDQVIIRQKLIEIGIHELSILFIDGWHSVNSALNDWKYVDMLVKGGKVIFHDVNVHPGPKIILDAIDKCMFSVENCFEEIFNVYGMAIATKL